MFLVCQDGVYRRIDCTLQQLIARQQVYVSKEAAKGRKLNEIIFCWSSYEGNMDVEPEPPKLRIRTFSELVDASRIHENNKRNRFSHSA